MDTVILVTTNPVIDPFNQARATCWRAEVDWFFWTGPIVNL
jgi:hypothetical protein